MHRAIPLVVLVACSSSHERRAELEAPPPSSLRLTSSGFTDGAALPIAYTCEASEHSPPLAWSGAPAGTRAFALIVDDPDAPDPAAPTTTWVHWVVYDLPATTTALAEGASTALPAGAHQGKNGWGKPGYGGACPPVGRHRYVHKLYALDVVLGDLGPLDADSLAVAIKGHVLAEARLIGTYAKSR